MNISQGALTSSRSVVTSMSGILVRLAWGIAVQMALLFGGAGTWRWKEAWLYIIFLSCYGFFVGAWLRKNSPDLLRERMTFWKRSIYGWDKLILLAALPLYVALLVIPGLDAVRWRLSTVPLPLKGIGFGVFVVAMLLLFRVMKENAFLSRFVEVQRDRGHRVISTGLYGRVRHPMYAAAILGFTSLPLALGSWIGFIPAALLSALFVIRIFPEERTLLGELEGYRDYVGKVRHRLIPGIW